MDNFEWATITLSTSVANLASHNDSLLFLQATEKKNRRKFYLAQQHMYIKFQKHEK